MILQNLGVPELDLQLRSSTTYALLGIFATLVVTKIIRVRAEQAKVCSQFMILITPTSWHLALSARRNPNHRSSRPIWILPRSFKVPLPWEADGRRGILQGAFLLKRGFPTTCSDFLYST